jgi:hypothetical protein
MTGLAAARHPAGGDDGDGHAAAALRAETRGVERARATGALGCGLTAPGAVSRRGCQSKRHLSMVGWVGSVGSVGSVRWRR